MTATPNRPFSLRYLEQIETGSHTSWVRGGISIGLFVYLLSFLSEFSGVADPQNLVSEGLTILLLSFALWQSLRGSAVLGASIAVGAIWLEIHYYLFISTELEGTGIPALPVLVAGAGILVGGRIALTLGLVSAVTAPGVVVLGRFFQGIEPVLRTEELKFIFTSGAILVAMAFLISLGLKRFGEVLESARRNERRFSDLIARNPDGIVAVDQEERVEAFNEAAERILGIPREEALGAFLSELEGGFGIGLLSSPVDPDLSLRPAPVELLVTRPDGTEVVVEVEGQPVTRSDGTPGRILVLRDLTARRHAEARATQAGRIVEEARSEIYVFDRHTLEILVASRGARENLGYSRSEILGMPMSRIQPTLTPEAGAALASDLYENGTEVVALTTVHHRKDGTSYPLEVQLQKGQLEGGPAVVAFGVDLSDKERAAEEQKALQAQLQHAQKMEAIGLLAGGVAHDFNNLLTVIGGCGEMLLESEDVQVKRLSGEILEAQDRGAALTRQLLAFGRRETVQPESLVLAEVLEEMENLIRRVLGEDVILNLDTACREVIRADRGQLEQVVLNLAANSRDAMPDGGVLEISIESDLAGETGSSDFVTLQVRDTGSGMEPHVLERVFEPFYTTKPRGKGTGLGLSTVHGIVNQNGGRISVESRPGEGTSFLVSWPAVRKRAAGTEAPETETTLPGAGRTVLVAEDERSMRNLIRDILEREGYQVVLAKDGQEAATQLEDPDSEFDLLLTDIVMPGLSGLEVAERARSLRPTLPTLFMSGYVDTNLQGIDGPPEDLRLLAKPFRRAELCTRVAEMLSSG